MLRTKHKSKPNLMAWATPKLSGPSNLDPALTMTPRVVTAEAGALTDETVNPFGRVDVWNQINYGTQVEGTLLQPHRCQLELMTRRAFATGPLLNQIITTNNYPYLKVKDDVYISNVR